MKWFYPGFCLSFMMLRCLLLSWLLLDNMVTLAQPELRAYYNKFEWAGLAAGYSVSRWRFEASGSYHPGQVVGPHATGHPDSLINGYITYPVFEDDVWEQNTTTVTARILRSLKKQRPAFGLYYGIYLRYVGQKSTLTDPHWSVVEDDFVNRYRTPTSGRYSKVGAGLVFGARGTIAGNVFWDVNISFLPFVYSEQTWHYTDGNDDSQIWSGATYLAEDARHFFQGGIGYKFLPREKQ
jgi:hypothetical protein